MSRETDFGDFNLFPKCLKLWIFSRFYRVVLAKLRVNKTIKDYIDNKVKPHIEETAKEIIKRTKYEINDDIYCKCSDDKSTKGCVKNPFKIIEDGPSLLRNELSCGKRDEKIISEYTYNFALRPEEHQPSGFMNWSRIDNYYFDFKKPGICFSCIMVNGMPK